MIAPVTVLVIALGAAMNAASPADPFPPERLSAILLEEIDEAERAVMSGGRALGDVPGMDVIQATACGQAGADYWRYLTAQQMELDGPEAVFAAHRSAVAGAAEAIGRMTADPDWGPIRMDIDSTPEAAPLAQEIVARARADQAASQLFHPASAHGESAQLMAAARAYCVVVDENHLFLDRVIERVGFPHLSEFGRTAQRAFWLLSIHQDNRERAVVLQAGADTAFSRGEMAPELYAQLRDFTSMLHGGEQIFGQYHACQDGRSVFQPPLRDREAADRVRAALGMPSVAEREAQMTRLMRCAERAAAAPAG